MKRKILIAAGGTGGHLFPAQALAKKLQQEGFEVLFGGCGLAQNRYFNRDQFVFVDVSSATPYKGNLIVSIFSLFKGIWQSLKALYSFKPDLIVGFGSYHSFPILAAALLRRVPIVLYVADSIPGKVNRFFSRWAVATAVQFKEAEKYLAGKTVEVWQQVERTVTQEEARAYFSLRSDIKTILVFGGSQGASFINQLLCNMASSGLKEFQIIHLTGNEESARHISEHYKKCAIAACVKAFEHQMLYAWSAASFAITRSGAGTFSEAITFGIPCIFIPYPHAAEDHQKKNALLMQDEIKGGLMCLEQEVNAKTLLPIIKELDIEGMRQALLEYKRAKVDLSSLCKHTILSELAALG